LEARDHECCRIEAKIREYLPETEARAVASGIESLARDVDDEITKILSDPLVLRLFNYDGKLFTPRGAYSFHRVFDGIRILQSLTDFSLECYFRSGDCAAAVRWLMDDLEAHLWQARVRRMNWEEGGSLHSIPDDLIAEVARRAGAVDRRFKCESGKPFELTPEELSFFKAYEEEMELRPNFKDAA
jgi:hypothetical protein